MYGYMPKRTLKPSDKTRVLHNIRLKQARALHRLPMWADLQAIKDVYTEARRRNLAEGIDAYMMRWSSVDPWQVDHIYPLKGFLISGLHVHDNLQVIRRSANEAKDRQLESLPY
jgi:hypothetical protein